MNQRDYFDFIYMMTPGFKEFNIFLRKFTCKDLRSAYFNWNYDFIHYKIFP